jgi:ankyrin repeat protein
MHVVQYLVENGANIDYQNDIGSTALIFAVKNEHKKMVRILIIKMILEVQL